MKYNKLGYEYFIAYRYLLARRKQTVISIVTSISILGVALGVFALIVVIAVMSGFEEDLRQKILGTNAHIVVLKADGIDVQELPAAMKIIMSDQRVKGAAPFVYSKVMIDNRGRADGIILKGIDTDLIGLVSDLENNIVDGSLEELDRKSGTQPRILLGKELAQNLGAQIGSIVRLVIPSGRITPSGAVPRVRPFLVCGTFATGMYEYDNSMAYIHIEDAQELFHFDDRYSGIEINIYDIFKARSVSHALQNEFGFSYWIRDWIDMNRTFFSALKLEKIAMFIILVLIILVAAFNIIGTLTMMVMEKSKDIGIMKAMGAHPSDIRKIFMMEGIIIGIIGTIAGVICGVLTCYIADHYQLIKLEGEVYYLSYLPFLIRTFDVLIICVAALVISFAATIIPATQAAHLKPVEAIRYE